MAIQFPSLIDFMDEYGMKELHNMHNDHLETFGVNSSFSDFVQVYYNDARDEWNLKRICNVRIKTPEFNDETDIDMSLQMAKECFAKIFNIGDRHITAGQIVETDELAPDHHSATMVVDTFHNKLIPAIQKFLNEYKG
jgi:hypothetical protein